MASKFDHDLTGFNHPSLNYKPPKELQRFRFGLAALAVLILLSGGWTVYWLVLAQATEGAVRGWIADQRESGAEAAYDVFDVGGFPRTVALTLTRPRWSGAVGAAAVKWEGERLVLAVDPFKPLEVRADAAGRHTLMWDGQRYSGRAGQVMAVAALGGPWPDQARLLIRNLDLVGDGNVVARNLDMAYRVDGDGLRVEISGGGMVLPNGVVLPLGQEIGRLEAAIGVSGPLEGGPGAKEMLTVWRDGGGLARIERLDLDYQTLSVSAGGQARLDETLQPAGELTAKIRGVFQTLDLLRAKRMVKDSDVVVAKMALSAFVQEDPASGAPYLNAQVGLQGGVLSLSGLPVAKVPPIRWGD